MRRVLPLLIVMSLGFAPAPVYRPKPGNSVAVNDLVGTWRCVALRCTTDEKPLDPAAENAGTVTITAARWLFGDGRAKFDLRIDHAKTPAEFDLAYSGQVEPHFRGVIERRGDTVRVIYSCQSRPTGFDSKAANCYVMTLKRQ
jgi:uncharacterized protein (TIGR03067 family)